MLRLCGVDLNDDLFRIIRILTFVFPTDLQPAHSTTICIGTSLQFINDHVIATFIHSFIVIQFSGYEPKTGFIT